MGDRHIPIIDEDKLDDIITALQNLSAPSGTDVAISPTGMHIVTEDDVQGAISELDAKAYEINSSLTNYVKLKSVDIPCSVIATNGTNISSYLTTDTGYSYLCCVQITGLGWVPSFPIFLDDLTKRCWYEGTLVSARSIRVFYLEIRNV